MVVPLGRGRAIRSLQKMFDFYGVFHGINMLTAFKC
ncbi:Uncharacterized protein ALO86_00869 [Pseudomonas syringae pv. berberidis]|nr:Uncharacterized protein ALO86_00869 [Pseudomonas syringae pv. berberidis]